MSQEKANNLGELVQNHAVNDQEALLLQKSIDDYIDDKKNIYNAILKFLEDSEENKNDENDAYSFQDLREILNSHLIFEDLHEIRQILQIINNIGNNHRRVGNFISKINSILLNYKTQIKQALSNTEIFDIFKSNKMIVHFLLKNDILTLSQTICEEMINTLDLNGDRYCYFFFTEIEKFAGKDKMKDIKKELLSKYPNVFDNYDIKRQTGENDSYICSMIREDMIKEFVQYVNQTNYDLSSDIKPSPFETNPFLIMKKNVTLIEYSAFFGSIQILKFLTMNKINLTKSLCIFAIHSNNAELIHFLESNKILTSERENVYFLKYYIESIKCHHNNFADYFETNYLQQNEEEKILSKCLKYHNWALLQNHIICKFCFFDLCYYDYHKLINLLMKKKENEIEKEIIKTLIFFNQEMISLGKI